MNFFRKTSMVITNRLTDRRIYTRRNVWMLKARPYIWQHQLLAGATSLLLLFEKKIRFCKILLTLTATGGRGGGFSAPPLVFFLQIALKFFMTGYCHFFIFPQMMFEGYFWSKNNQNIFISGVTY